MKPKIVFYEMTERWQEEFLKNRLIGYDLAFKQEILGDSNLPDADVDIISTFVASRVSIGVLAHLKNLKFVATRSTGYDQINLQACRERSVLVSNVPAYGENTVAEFAFTLILALMRNLYPAIKRVREQAWFNCEGLQGRDLRGKTLGVVGTGHIGMHVVRIAQGFEMNVAAYDAFPKAELANQYNFKYVSLDDLLQQSDIVTLHAPYLPSTHHLINKDNIGKFKKGALLINTARGGLVETESLIGALKNGQLAGAALDVLEEEGFIREEAEILSRGHPNEQQLRLALADHELMQMPNVIITPHTAFNTREALERILDATAENILSFINGSPKNLVELKT